MLPPLAYSKVDDTIHTITFSVNTKEISLPRLSRITTGRACQTQLTETTAVNGKSSLFVSRQVNIIAPSDSPITSAMKSPAAISSSLQKRYRDIEAILLVSSWTSDGLNPMSVRLAVSGIVVRSWEHNHPPALPAQTRPEI